MQPPRRTSCRQFWRWRDGPHAGRENLGRPRGAQRGQVSPTCSYIDLHLIHEVTSPQAFDGLRAAGRKVRRPDLTIATEDHNVPTTGITGPESRSGRAARSRAQQVEALRRTAPSSASGCIPWATPARASCTSSARSSG